MNDNCLLNFIIFGYFYLNAAGYNFYASLLNEDRLLNEISLEEAYDSFYCR